MVDVLDVVDVRQLVAQVSLFQSLEIRRELRVVLARCFPVEGRLQRLQPVGTW
jgi:hypothetical protein